jgi:hypothetical protein
MLSLHSARLCQPSDFAGHPNVFPLVSRRVGRSPSCSRRIAWNRQARGWARPGAPTRRGGGRQPLMPEAHYRREDGTAVALYVITDPDEFGGGALPKLESAFLQRSVRSNRDRVHGSLEGVGLMSPRTLPSRRCIPPMPGARHYDLCPVRNRPTVTPVFVFHWLWRCRAVTLALEAMQLVEPCSAPSGPVQLAGGIVPACRCRSPAGWEDGPRWKCDTVYSGVNTWCSKSSGGKDGNQ